MITAQQVKSAALGQVNVSNMNSVLVALDKYGAQFGLDKAHRLAQFMAQLMHESGDFRYDREVWGPTTAQNGYEGRKDLGNTQKGDGKKFSGRGAIQITGRANYKEFTSWCRSNLNTVVPDFSQEPDKINTDPYEGLVPIWYWSTRDLNRYADNGDIESITRKINGGKNGLEDRINHYVRIALVLLGYKPTELTRFQGEHKLVPDGDAGPQTRAGLHKALLGIDGLSTQMKAYNAAPVVEETKTVPKSVDTKVKDKTNNAALLFAGSGLGGSAVTSAFGAPWQTVAVIGGVALVAVIVLFLLRRQIIGAIKEIRGEVEDAQ